MLALFFFAPLAFSAPAGLTFQGRLVNNDVAVESASVSLTIQVRSPATDSCLLYEETHTLNMTGSDGIFTIKIGGGTRTVNDMALTLVQVFSNTGTAINGLTCTSGATTYTSSSSDTRSIYVSFVDNGTTVNFTSPYIIQSVPYALEAERLAGKSSTDFLQITANTTQSKVNALMVPATYTELLALLTGASTQYMTSSATNGTSMPVLSSAPSSPSAGTMWYEGGVLKYYDGVSSSVKTLGTSTGTTADTIANGGQAGSLSLGTSDANNLTLKTNGSTRMTILSNGKVGIGVTNPLSPLDVLFADGSIASDVRTRGFVSEYYGVGPYGGKGGIAMVAGGTKASPTGVAANDFASLAQSLFYDGTNWRVGSRIDSYVASVTNATNVASGLTFNVGTATGDAASGQFTGITEAMRILPSGNVGIGTTTPSRPLSVVGTAMVERPADSAAIMLKRTGAGTKEFFLGVSASGANTGAFQIADYGAAEEVGPYNRFLITNSGDIGLGSASSTSISTTLANATMVVMGTGYVGIGTASPSTPLHVFSSSTNPMVTLETSGATSPGMTLKNSSGTVKMSLNSLRDFSFNDITGGPARLLIRSNGYVGIGDYYAAANYPQNKLSVNGSASIGFATASDVAAPSNGLLVNGSVGIGTATPATGLEVYSGSAAAPPTSGTAPTGALRLGQSGSAMVMDMGTLSGTGAYIQSTLRTNLASNFSLLLNPNGGNVGIGTTAPQGKLDVNGSIFSGIFNTTGSYGFKYDPATGNAQFSRSSDGTIPIIINTGANSVTVGSVLASTLASAGNTTRISLGTSTVGMGTAGTTNLLLDTATGNVGIGTATPAKRLHVLDSMQLGDLSNDGSLNILGTSETNAYVKVTGSSNMGVLYPYGVVGTRTGFELSNSYVGGSLNFKVSQAAARDTTAMQITSAGKVGIGTTTPSAPLHVSTTAVTGNIATFVSTGAGGAGCSIAWNGTSCSSDARLKENVTSADSTAMLDDLLKARPVHFTWIKDPAHEKQTGFIAQEIEKLFPEFVKTDPKGYKQVNYAHFVAVLTAAVQEFYAQWHQDSQAIHRDIASLQSENDQLKTENKVLKNQLDQQAKDLEAIKKHLGL